MQYGQRNVARGDSADGADHDEAVGGGDGVFGKIHLKKYRMGCVEDGMSAIVEGRDPVSGRGVRIR